MKVDVDGLEVRPTIPPEHEIQMFEIGPRGTTFPVGRIVRLVGLAASWSGDQRSSWLAPRAETNCRCLPRIRLHAATMFRTVRTLADYRTLSGAPRRGVCRPCSAAEAWVQAVRRRAEALRCLSGRSFRTAADALRAAIATSADVTQIDHAIESFALTDE